MLQSEQLAKTPNPSLPRKKGLSHQSRSEGRKKSRWMRAASCRERGGSERKYEKESKSSTMKEGGFQRGQKQQARRAPIGDEDEEDDSKSK